MIRTLKWYFDDHVWMVGTWKWAVKFLMIVWLIFFICGTTGIFEILINLSATFVNGLYSALYWLRKVILNQGNQEKGKFDWYSGYSEWFVSVYGLIVWIVYIHLRKLLLGSWIRSSIQKAVLDTAFKCILDSYSVPDTGGLLFII